MIGLNILEYIQINQTLQVCIQRIYIFYSERNITYLTVLRINQALFQITLHGRAPFLFIQTLQSRYRYCPHFTEEELRHSSENSPRLYTKQVKKPRCKLWSLLLEPMALATTQQSPSKNKYKIPSKTYAAVLQQY